MTVKGRDDVIRIVKRSLSKPLTEMQALQSTFAGVRVAVKARAAKATVNTAVVARRTKAAPAASSSQWFVALAPPGLSVAAR